jgi:hypothetical protein
LQERQLLTLLKQLLLQHSRELDPTQQQHVHPARALHDIPFDALHAVAHRSPLTFEPSLFRSLPI